ncbi:MAG: sugar transferase [Promethearchaeota archaeon]|jgi:lipopolysaccharide/colanic/teichoic acid biosynthesis glycosyltransferase
MALKRLENNWTSSSISPLAYHPKYLKICHHKTKVSGLIIFMANSSHSPSISELNGSPGIPHKLIVRLPNLLGNFLLYLFAYTLVYWLKYNNIELGAKFTNFLFLYIAAWVTGGVISGKFRFQSLTSLNTCLNQCYTSLLISLGVVAFLLAEFSVTISRLVVIGSFFSALIIEIALFLIKNRNITVSKSPSKKRFSVAAPIIDFLLLSWVFYFLYDQKVGFNNIDENQIILLLGTYLSWFLSAIITHQFTSFTEKTNVWSAISLQLKFYLLIVALMSFIVYILQIDQNYRTLYLTAIIIYASWSFIVMLFLYIDKLPQKTDDVTTDFLHAFEIKAPKIQRVNKDIPDTKYKLFGHAPKASPLPEKLEFIYFKKYPEVFSFLERKLHLNTFEIDKTTILKSRDPYNVSVFPENYLELFINLHKINDIRRINKYFIEVNNRLCEGGIFVGNFEPIKYRYERFRKKYPFILANVLYLFDFLWKRAAPKLPIVRKIYFILTKGQDRALPLAEGLGRLYYCGFEIIDLKVMDNLCYFVAKKIDSPSEDENPSISPIIKMRRQGQNGNTVFVYKVRTMHPYSEYLQEFIYNNNSLQDGGKFNKDFRITKWGAVFRKLWIDELPMLVNFIKGELKFVGVRPISEQYLSLYDEEFRKKRMSYKPGLVPPYYADMPKNISEIILSEKKYLDEYDKYKIKTDIKYFLKAFYNIVVNKERSR